MKRASSRVFPGLLLVAGIVCCGPAAAQSYPSRPVKVIIGTTAGGATDIVFRLINSALEKRLGQPLVIDYRPGAQNTIAARAVMRAEPDGHTIYLGGTEGMHPTVIMEGIDCAKEFAWIGEVSASPWYVYVRSDLSIGTLKELVAYSKANPGKLNFASPDQSNTVMMGVLEAKTGITSVKVPYKGAAPAVAAMLAGEADVTVSLLSPFLSAVQGNRVKALLSTRRSALLPGLPTAAELGVNDYDAAATLSFLAPLATPSAVVRTLSTANTAVLKSPEVTAAFAKLDLLPLGTTPEDALASFNKAVQQKAEAMRIAGLKPQ